MVDKTNIVEMVCRKCGRKYKDEMLKLTKKGKREGKVFGKILGSLLPEEVKEEMDAHLKKLIELTGGLCEKCMKEATKSLPPPSFLKNVPDHR